MLLCCDVRSEHEDISLVPVEQFYKEATEDVSKPVSSLSVSLSLSVVFTLFELTDAEVNKVNNNKNKNKSCSGIILCFSVKLM